MTDLVNKTIVITGAAGGFGQHFTEQLLAKGNRLILTDLHEEKLAEIARDLLAKTGRGEILACIGGDLSTRPGVQTLYNRITQLNQPIDILINNAGIGLMGRHDEVPVEQWERLMAVNLIAPMRLTALIVPQMIERGSGHIINIASMASWMDDVGLSAYVASKFGLRGFSLALMSELTRHNVHVSAVYPFYSRTPILKSPRYGSLADKMPSSEAEIPGLTDPADVVRAVLKGVEKNEQHIFPDPVGKLLHRLGRYAPWLLRYLVKRMRPTAGK